MNPAIAMWLWWLMWTPDQCTRCGGSGHTLSQCRWPRVVRSKSGME
jgi:hypothetical protein